MAMVRSGRLKRVKHALVAGAGAAGHQPLGGLAHGVGGEGGPPLEVLGQPRALLASPRYQAKAALTISVASHSAPRRRIRNRISRDYAPNFVSLSALAMTSGIR